jgi:hypothetical protein
MNMQMKPFLKLTLMISALSMAAMSLTSLAAEAPPKKLGPKFRLLNGQPVQICPNKEALGKAACEAAASTMFPGATVTCTAKNVKLDGDCKVVDVECDCTGTR